jgi:hypothetical protein
MLAHLAGDGGKQARLTRKSTKETVKTIAQGRPGETASTCGDYDSCGFFSSTRGRGCRQSTRLSLRPPIFREWLNLYARLGRGSRREKANARHFKS